MKRRFFFFSVTFFAFLLFVGCTKGRVNLFSWEDEERLGAEIHEQIVSDTIQYRILPESNYNEVYSRINTICKTLSKSPISRSQQASVMWSIYILEDDQIVNAFSTPGGGIYIYTGLLRFMKSEAELAGVLSHEMAHVYCRHATSALTKNLGLSLLLGMLGASSDIGGALSDLASSALLLKFSRDDESEADKYAVKYLSSTDYDIGEFITFFRMMEEEEDKEFSETSSLRTIMEFYSTHPNPQHRIEAIKTEWARCGNRRGNKYVDEYKELLSKLPIPEQMKEEDPVTYSVEQVKLY